MSTPVERIARLEEQILGVREDLAAVVAMIGDNRAPGSVRGRLHAVENDVRALKLIRQGASQLVGRTWKVIAGVCLLLVTAAPYVLYFASR